MSMLWVYVHHTMYVHADAVAQAPHVVRQKKQHIHVRQAGTPVAPYANAIIPTPAVIPRDTGRQHMAHAMQQKTRKHAICVP